MGLGFEIHFIVLYYMNPTQQNFTTRYDALNPTYPLNFIHSSRHGTNTFVRESKYPKHFRF